jgi:hypothetical protein
VPIAAVAVVIAVLLVRHLLIRRSLASRVEFEMLPSLHFDPTPEEVERFARQLTRTRPAESWGRPRRGVSVRIRMATDEEGKLGYSIAGPAGSQSVLRHPTYRQVDIIRPTVPE